MKVEFFDILFVFFFVNMCGFLKKLSLYILYCQDSVT